MALRHTVSQDADLIFNYLNVLMCRFYPYHYAPRASDFYDIDKFEFHFSIGKPFKPFDQLMGVLPAASAHALPLFYRKLMTDALSPILDFYPADFQVDINGKRFAWQGICKLPFIEESRLLAEIAKVEHTLTDEERRRNSFGRDVLFVHISHPLGEGINSFCKKVNGDTKLLEGEVIGKIDPKFSDGMNGFICLSDKSVWPVEIHSPIEGMKMIAKNGVLSVFYHNPPFHSHIPRPLPGVILFEEGLRNMRGGSEKRKLIGGAFVANKIGAPREQNKGDGNQIRAHGLQETKIELSVDLLQEIRAKVKPNWLHPRIIADVSTNGLQGTKTEVNVDGGEEIRTEVNSNVVQHVKTEVMSRKQNRKGKKQNLGEAGDDPHKGVEKFDGSGPSEQNKGDGNKAGATGLQGTITEVNANVFEGTKAEVNADGLQGIRTEVNANGVQGIKAEVNVDGLQGLRTEVTASGVQDVKTEVISRKRKWKAKKKKLAEGGDGPDKGVEKFESIAPSEQNKGDGNQAGSTGLQGTITEGCTNVFQGTKPEVNTDGLQGKKTEANKDGLQGIRTEVNASGVQDVKTEVLSRWKRKSKKKKLGEGGDALQKVDDVHMGVEKFDSNASSNQNKVEGNQDDADRLQETITEVNANVLQGIKPEVNADRLLGIRAEVNANGLQDVKSEVVSRKRKRKSKKMKSGERGVAKFEGSCPSEQNERNGNQGGGADGSQGTITEGNANGFLGTKPEVNANGSAGVEIEVEGIKTEAKSSKRKPRAKKRKQNKIDSALTNIFDKLES
ncbi:hypothetical protein Patl1_24308 [Pistacia atlantica]|uniref:Uncharacterized protein n=1 Tax=Pistacia atlantica TaxID=434234 RepID=A0ACC0ZU81_9ROSI|nr:hypothetical protein Patl1_24308 [Pistacia atlantica]